MRDPSRISRVLELVRKCWETQPDLRLGQLIQNVCEPYYTEDEELEEKLTARYIGCVKCGRQHVNECDESQDSGQKERP